MNSYPPSIEMINGRGDPWRFPPKSRTSLLAISFPLCRYWIFNTHEKDGVEKMALETIPYAQPFIRSKAQYVARWVCHGGHGPVMSFQRIYTRTYSKIAEIWRLMGSNAVKTNLNLKKAPQNEILTCQEVPDADHSIVTSGTSSQGVDIVDE